jgi:hypothetical protein
MMIYVFLLVLGATYARLRGHQLSCSCYYYYSYGILISILLMLFVFFIKKWIYNPLCEINQVVANLILGVM